LRRPQIRYDLLDRNRVLREEGASRPLIIEEPHVRKQARIEQSLTVKGVLTADDAGDLTFGEPSITEAETAPAPVDDATATRGDATSIAILLS
jgi:hypothetical protein